MSNKTRGMIAGVIFAGLASVTPASADVELAVVHVFEQPLQDIVAQFIQDYPEYSGIQFNYNAGSAGGLYNDIYTALSNAGQSPYDMFFSVDSTYPNQLRTAFPSSVSVPFQYAQGSLVLVSNSSINVTNGLPSNFASTAICNPTAGPYGDAALDVLQNTYSIPSTDMRISRWNGIGLVKTAIENVTVNTGFLAKAQVCVNGQLNVTQTIGASATAHEFTPGSGYASSVLLHTGVLIARSSRTSEETAAIEALATYLDGATAQGIIQSYCYTSPTTRGTATQAFASIKAQLVKFAKPAGSPKPKH